MQWSETSWLYLLIPAIPLLIWYHFRSLSDFPRWQKRVSLALRLIVLALLVASLASPVLMRATEKQIVVFAIDRSESVDAEASKKAIQYIDEATAAAKAADIEVKFLEFDRVPRDLTEQYDLTQQQSAPESSNDNSQEQDVSSATTNTPRRRRLPMISRRTMSSRMINGMTIQPTHRTAAARIWRPPCGPQSPRCPLHVFGVWSC